MGRDILGYIKVLFVVSIFLIGICVGLNAPDEDSTVMKERELENVSTPSMKIAQMNDANTSDTRYVIIGHGKVKEINGEFLSVLKVKDTKTGEVYLGLVPLN